MQEVMTLIEQKNFVEVKNLFKTANIIDIASIFDDIKTKEQAALIFKLIPKNTAAEVFSYLKHDKQEILILSFTDKEIATIINDLFIDDAIDLIEEMPANVVERILKNTNSETRDIINKMLLYPAYSAGSLMTIEFIDLKANLTVDACFKRIRKVGVDKETINNCYVTDSKRVLTGVINVKELLLANPKQKIGDIMNTNIIYVNTYEEREAVAQKFAKYDLTILPVVDMEQRLVGIITVDDVIDVIQQEHTEDTQKMAAIAPIENEYLKTSVFTHFKKRIFWLVILMFTASITGSIIASYEETILLIPALVTFIPMLMNTGGNCGNQSSALTIRSMAVGEIKTSDYFKVFFKEFRVSLLVGLVLSLFIFFKIWLIDNLLSLAIIVACTMFLTVVVAKLIGFSLPIIAKLLKIDPAIVSAPLITTMVDAVAILSLFLIASMFYQL